VVHDGAMYFTDRGIEELEDRRGDEEITFTWLADELRNSSASQVKVISSSPRRSSSSSIPLSVKYMAFVDLNPEFEVPVERLATFLARLDDEDE
jgi:hypothetical protein